MTRVGAPGSGTCALSQTPLGDCQSLSPPGTRGACLPRHAAPDMLVTKADILSQVFPSTHPKSKELQRVD